MARKPTLDGPKQREVLAILAMGCSRAAAAGYVGCSRDAIGRLAARDPGFASQLARAESLAQIDFMKSIRSATENDKQWRAAAWALERRYPEDFRLRGPDCLTPGELAEFIAEISEIILQELPASRYRKAVLKRLQEMTPRIRGGESPPEQTPETSDDESQ
ncbi:MAG: hypothetical protein GXY83_40295 [Rhodopirellula sp.]|nr:hypothetical protein [Rhodopirellula sp.]